MKESLDNNKIIEDSREVDVEKYRYNFINTPWDDRTNKSKIGIVTFLIATLVATLALVFNNLLMHYKGFDEEKNSNSSDLNCYLVKMGNNRFAARIHSISSQELLCLGAVVSATSVLANEVCVKSGPVRLHVGSLTDPLCKKGFVVDVMEYIYHEGVMSKKLVLLSTHENMAECADVIRVGHTLDWRLLAYIVGRPSHGGRSLSRQPVRLVGKSNCTSMKLLPAESTICVHSFARCPVRAGDLLIQNGKLLGLASTSVHSADQNKLAYFADLYFVRQELKELDVDITTEQ